PGTKATLISLPPALSSSGTAPVLAVIVGPGLNWTRTPKRDVVTGGGRSGPGPTMAAGSTVACNVALVPGTKATLIALLP
ncbi:MAG: hypothetical protein NWS62_00780, partial [Gaiellales bacterium]|nr:hypothetical protein [Gaiellales bacterium]